MFRDRYLSWNIFLDKKLNRVCVQLQESTQGLSTPWIRKDVVADSYITIWPWTTEVDLAVKLNKVQAKLLRRYRDNHNKWFDFETMISKFVGGKIILDDLDTCEYIKKIKKGNRFLRR